MLFLTFWLLFGQAKSNKACMADAKQYENGNGNENGNRMRMRKRMRARKKQNEKH